MKRKGKGPNKALGFLIVTLGLVLLAYLLLQPHLTSRAPDLTTTSPVTANVEQTTGEETSQETTSQEAETSSSQAVEEDQDWALILINLKNPVPKDWDHQLTDLENGMQIDQRVYPYLMDLIKAGEKAGLGILVRQAYRTEDQQAQLSEEKVAEFLGLGYDQAQAEKLAMEWVAPPGHSEHELGLAVDLNADPEISSADQVYSWLAQYAPSHGFILRYPPDKTAITGVAHEPWHYRYVGREAAQAMAKDGLTLEEYLEKRKKK